MNKTDMQKDADKLIALGKDPDLVYTYTLDEYAGMHNDEVDDFDEIKKDISTYSSKIDECTATIQILQDETSKINAQISECEKNAEEYEQRRTTTRNYMEAREIDEWIKEEEKERASLMFLKDRKKEEIKNLERQRDEYIEKLATLKVQLETMFPAEEKIVDDPTPSVLTDGPIQADDFVQMTFADQLEAMEATHEILQEKTLEIDGYGFEMHCLEEDIKSIDAQIAQLVEQRKTKVSEYEAARQNKERAIAQYNEIEGTRRKM